MTYTVQQGDTLEGISLRFLGTKEAAGTLFNINRGAIKSGSPSRLAPGERLTIPEQMIQASDAKGAKLDPLQVGLEVNGLSYSGWESVTVTRSLEAASGAFSLAIYDKWLATGEAWPIFEGDKVRVWIGRDLVLDGYVDSIDLSSDAQSRSLSVSGRDRTCDLIDCSAMNRPGVFKGKKLEAIAALLARPFGVKVICDVNTGPAIKAFALQPGEKVHAAIERAARAINLMVTATESGELLITRSGSQKATDAIVEGKNFLSGNSKASCADRFSVYVVEGQGSGQGKEKHSHRGEYRDPSVGRYRPLIIKAEAKADGTYVKGRAEWEARARAAKGRSAAVTVQGWRQSSGKLWQINRLVTAQVPSINLDGEMLISEVTFSVSDQGTVTTLNLIRPDAYLSEESLKAVKDVLKGRKPAKGKGKGKKEAGVLTPGDYKHAMEDVDK